MKVLTHIGGSKCVVELNRPCPDWQLTYIDARADVRYPSFSFIEVVRDGRVVHMESSPDFRAPEKIIELTKEYR